MKHLDEGILQAWVDRARSGISRAEVAEIERHLQECEACATRASAAESLTLRARAVLSSAGPVDSGLPDYRSVLARAQKVPADAVRRRWWIATAWAASIAGALAAGWMSNDRFRSGQVALDSGTDQRPAVEASAVQATQAGPSPETEAALESAAPSVQEANVGGPRAGVASAEVAPAVAQVDSGVASPAAAPPAARSELAALDRAGVPTAGPSVLSGRVIHDLTGEPISAAQMTIEGTGVGALSRADGTFSLTLETGDTPLGPVALTAQRLGYSPVRLALGPVTGDTLFADVRLAPTQLALQGIVATGLVDPQDGVSPPAVAPVDVAPASTRQAAAAAPPNQAGASGVSSLAERRPPPGIEWVVTARAEAEARGGFQLVVVPELPLLGVEVGEGSGAYIVRVRQRLDSGEVLTLLEQRASLASTAPSPFLLQAGPGASVQKGEILITGVAPIPTDSLRILLDRAR